MEYFDWHNWRPQLYKSQDEMNKALDYFGITEKVISSVHVIGLAENMIPWKYTGLAQRALADASFAWDDILSGKQPLAKASLRHEVDICEPVVIIFTDGTTMELMPKNGDSLLMSVNQISPYCVDGTNNHNFDSDAFFNCLHGRRIEHIERINREDVVPKRKSENRIDRRSISLQFWLTGNEASEVYGFFLHQDWEGWFQFGITNQQYSDELVHMVPFSFFSEAAKKNCQITIVEGHDGSSYFWIMPVTLMGGAKEEVQEYRTEEISIEESDIHDYLYVFLEKYFDPDFPYERISSDCCCRSKEFEWNLEYNLYTYETVRAMLVDIEKCIDLLGKNYDDPYLEDVKKGYRWDSFVAREVGIDEKLTSKEEKEIIRSNIQVATDFYKRFVRRMRAMMDHSPDYNLITFMGP